jgi:predicted outer membrane repeat protein
MTVDSTTFTGNSAGSYGGVFFIDNQITDSMTVTLTSCTFSSNTAYKSGGVLYLSNTATTSTVKFGGTSFATTTATTLDGGVFYLAAYISNYLEVKNSLVPANAVSSLSSSVAGQNGGAVYMNGATNTF